MSSQLESDMVAVERVDEYTTVRCLILQCHKSIMFLLSSQLSTHPSCPIARRETGHSRVW